MELLSINSKYCSDDQMSKWDNCCVILTGDIPLALQLFVIYDNM